MATWSEQSQKVYDELDPRLQVLVTRIRDEVHDISLLQGFRDREEQNTMFENDASMVRWPDSKHNRKPSLAIDLQPYPRYAEDTYLWCQLGYIAGAALIIAREEGFEIRWGGNWNCESPILGQKFKDLWHIEIKGGT
jgi:peptidoglycan L-alanyl-D-glutamate endopeptidase CwlK